MKAKFQKSDRVLLLIAIMGITGFVIFYPRLYPDAAVQFSADKAGIIDEATSLLEEYGYNVNQHQMRIAVYNNRNQIQYLNRTFGGPKTNQIVRDSIPAFYWELQYNQKEESESDTNQSKFFDGNIRIRADLKGRLIFFDANEKSVKNQPKQKGIPSESARKRAESLAIQITGEDPGLWTTEVKEPDNGKGNIQTFLLKRIMPVAGEKVSIEVNFENGRLRNFEKKYSIPENFVLTGDDNNIFAMLSFIIVYLVFVVLGMVFFVIRIRSDLLDLKIGLLPAVLALVGWIITFWIKVWNEPAWEVALSFIFTIPFIGGGLWAVFVLGESYTREVWAEKLATVDYLRKKFLFPELGVSLIRGMFLTFISLGFLAFYALVSLKYFNGYLDLGGNPLAAMSTSWPDLFAIGRGLLNSLFITVTFCLFFISFLKKVIRKSIAGPLILMICVWALVSFPVPFVQPVMLRIIMNICMGLLFIWFFIRYDFITVLTGALGLPVLYSSISLLHSGSGNQILHGILLLLVCGLILIWAFLCCQRESFVSELTPFMPDYLRRINEKERIQRDLEIARQVQKTFLPREKPKLAGIDIGSMCLPANEVGGDYYDFIPLGPGKLGIAVGDVSGKGIPAAFYMTLAKGFLRAQANHFPSPRDVLVSMNDLFYENAERDIFISMIYAVLDIKARTLCFSRAGHNPVIFRRSKNDNAEDVCPTGIALGLESGNLFAKTIEEKCVNIQKNDVFLFYTDGLNEAQNQHKHEFSEDRLRKAVDQYAAQSADAMLEKIRDDILSFMDDAPQHDDMTAVIIKIL